MASAVAARAAAAREGAAAAVTPGDKKRKATDDKSEEEETPPSGSDEEEEPRSAPGSTPGGRGRAGGRGKGRGAGKKGSAAAGAAGELRAHLKKVLPYYDMGYQFFYPLKGDSDHSLVWGGMNEKGERNDTPSLNCLVSLLSSLKRDYVPEYKEFMEDSTRAYSVAKLREAEEERLAGLNADDLEAEAERRLEEAAAMKEEAAKRRAAAAAAPAAATPGADSMAD